MEWVVHTDSGVARMKSISISFQEFEALIKWHNEMEIEYIDKDCYAESKMHRERAAELDMIFRQAHAERQAEILSRLRDTAEPDENVIAQQRRMHHDAILYEMHGKKMG